ncbi:MAG: YARHG domain-containing protein [Eggerthellaceae bacterium]|nr:YARHG domain-containing protein [Eggerthellaceae bacterium]
MKEIHASSLPKALCAAIVLCGIAIALTISLLTYCVIASYSPAGGASVPISSSPNDASASDFVLPQSDTRLYDRSELEGLSTWDLCVAHNEIYARHGRGFKTPELQAHFSSCPWYVELYSPEEYDAMPSPLSDIEQHNVDLLIELRRERGDY